MHDDHQGKEKKVAEKDVKLKTIRKKKMKKKNESNNGDHLMADDVLPDENRQAFAGVFDICRVNGDELHGEDGDRSFDLFQVRAKEVSGPLMGMMMKRGEGINVSDQNQMMIPGSHVRHISEATGLHVPGGEMFQAIPKWPWFIFLSGAMGCFVCSSLSHLLACHSFCFNLFFWRLDYAGISLMIVCSFFTPIYYSFYCNPYARLVYLTSITVLGILAVITLLAPVLSSARFRSFRAALFLTMGFSGVIPATHAVLLHWGHPHIHMALGFELAMALLYSAGASFYVSRIPEKWKPGAFDVAGHSHQIFHVFVVLGALAHSAAIIFILDFRRGSPVCV